MKLRIIMSFIFEVFLNKMIPNGTKYNNGLSSDRHID